MSTIFNLSSTLNNNVQNSLQSYNATFRNTVNVNLAAMMALTNVLEEQTGYITDLVIDSPETDVLMAGIMKIMQVGLSAGFLKLSSSGTSDKKFYLSFMIPYRPTACEIKLIAVAAVDVTYLIDGSHTVALPAAENAPSARDAHSLYVTDLAYSNANYTQWISELTTALNNSLDIVDAFIAADGGAQFA